MNKYNIDLEKCQDIYEYNYTMKNISDYLDFELSEVKESFLPRKKSSELLADSFERLQSKVEVASCLYSNKYAVSVRNCGTYLEFVKNVIGDFKLSNANFCRNRLCPMCSWRRSYKIFSQVSRIMDVIESEYRFIFITLTVPNVYGAELKSKIDEMQLNFREIFCKNKKWKKAIKGFFRALEITHDSEPFITPKMFACSKAYYKRLGLSVGSPNPNYNKYHPHFHIIAAVNSSYFHKSSDTYITHDDLLNMWRYAMNDYSITQVDIRPCKQKEVEATSEAASNFKNLSSAVAEVAKYSVKSSDYLIEDNPVLTDETVKTLFYALKGRRLCGLGGCFKETWKAIRRADEKDIGEGDLIDINGEIRGDVFVQLYRYEWSCGCYRLTEVLDNPELFKN